MTATVVDPRAQSIRHQGDRGAVLLIHGLTGSPYTFKSLASRLASEGYAVYAPLLSGHGTSPAILRHTRWNDWLMSAAHAFDEMAETHEKVSLVGFSMGALLSTILAHERGDRVAALVTMSPPLHLDFISQSLLSVGRRLPLASIMPYKRKATGPDVSDPAIAAAMPSYDRTPVAAAVSLIDAQEVARDRATRISVPTLVQHGRHDHTTPIRSGRAFYALLKTPHRRFISYPRSWHILPLDVDHQQVEDDVVSFLNDPKAFADGETLNG